MADLSDADFLRFDPFDGERDVEIRCRTSKIVTVRKEQRCHGEVLAGRNHGHAIKPGTKARYETALVDGEWGRYYHCLECLTPFVRECMGATDRGGHS